MVFLWGPLLTFILVQENLDSFYGQIKELSAISEIGRSKFGEKW